MHHLLQLLGIIPKDLHCIIFVANVWPSSAAAQAGFEEGDVIVEINGEEIVCWTREESTSVREYTEDDNFAPIRENWFGSDAEDVM